ncbi:helix-turn-helix domain-containing protein [Halorarius halobius]|uniref:helix-turn-helix domain-containing protein n=1 Tax=Halorarius halobius TaxID=2962671 RepID=UPI0020CD5B88|nr:helix-turn-helix domain-containing protein [Halorarius halobius]
MIDLTLDMEQYDCPFIDTTVANDVAFSAVHWEFDEARHQLATRMLVEGDDRGALENGLHTLDDHANMHELDLLSKQANVAHIRTTIEETAAMGTIRANDGYITGPFHIEAGSERWHVGFDREPVADETLGSLDADNEFSVVERSDMSLSDLSGFVQNVGAAMTLVDGCKDLSDTERVTLETAVQEGYFESPRGATLGDLADRFGVSKPAVSKRLRRGQGKLAENAVDALDDIDE